MQVPIDWQKYKYILEAAAMYSKQLSVLHWMNNSLISKVYLVYNVLIFQKLLEEKNSHIIIIMIIIIIVIIIKTYLASIN